MRDLSVESKIERVVNGVAGEHHRVDVDVLLDHTLDCSST
jgi:hypothetical protein